MLRIFWDEVMLSQSNINEVNQLLEHNNVASEDHEHIIRQIQYDMWDFKARASNAKQRDEIKKIQKSALYLLKNLRSLSWELSTELHEQLENEYRYNELFDEEGGGNYDEEYEDYDLKFRRALEDNADKLTLQFIYDESLEEAFGNVPINGTANAIDYVSKLAKSCQSLVDRKVDSKDKGLYPALQTRWEMIGEKYNIEITKTNSIEFISACTGKYVETAKKQFKAGGFCW